MATNGPYQSPVDIASWQAGLNFMPLQWTSGASGAVPTTLTKSYGVASVVHGATGVYVVTLSEQWAAYLGMIEEIMQASYSKNGACKVRRTAIDLTAKTITLLVVDGDGDAVEPASGDIISLTFLMQLTPNY